MVSRRALVDTPSVAAFALLVLWSLLLVLRLDSVISGRYAAIGVPLYAAAAAAGLATWGAAQQEKQYGLHSSVQIVHVALGCALPTATGAMLLVFLRVDCVLSTAWTVVLVPMYALAMVPIGLALREARLHFRAFKAARAGESPVSSTSPSSPASLAARASGLVGGSTSGSDGRHHRAASLAAAAFYGLVATALVLFVALLIARLDSRATQRALSPWAVAAPLLGLAALAPLGVCATSRARSAKRALPSKKAVGTARAVAVATIAAAVFALGVGLVVRATQRRSALAPGVLVLLLPTLGALGALLVRAGVAAKPRAVRRAPANPESPGTEPRPRASRTLGLEEDADENADNVPLTTVSARATQQPATPAEPQV